MERIYSVDKQFCNQFRYDSEFIARAEELGLVWSNPQAFIQSYNNREIGTIPGQYILRIVNIDPEQPNEPSYDKEIYCIREEYKGRDPEIVCSSIEGWTFRGMYHLADAFNTLQDSSGEPVFPTWDNILGLPYDKRADIKNMMRCFINMVGQGFHPDDEIVAGDRVSEEIATSANIFISYAFEVLGEDVYKVCEEIFVENGWMNR